MDMKYGFVEFYDEEDKIAHDFFKEVNNRDILGLRKMNVRISNILFPFGNTLMPNLVYFYYLNAIFYVLKKSGRVPTEKEINKYEQRISHSICQHKDFPKKGFLDQAKIRAYSRYKSSMSRMHYFEEGWKAHDCLEKSALESLQDTKRYQLVKKVITEDIMDIEFPKGETWPYMLEDAERLDFIRRVVLPYKVLPNDEKTQYSVFSNIVMYYAMIKQKPSGMQTIYSEKWWEKYNKSRYSEDWRKKYKESRETNEKEYEYDFSKIETFHNLEKYFNYIPDGFDNKNRKNDYEIAMIYSKLQGIAKLTYKVCLFDSREDMQEKYVKSLEKEVSQIRNRNKEAKGKWHRYFNPKNYDPQSNNPKTEKLKSTKYDNFIGKEQESREPDEMLVNAFRFIYSIAETVFSKSSEGIEEILSSLKEIVKNRESEIMGDNSILGSGIQVNNVRADYVDTFRWEYRPEYAYEDALEGEWNLVVETEEESQENEEKEENEENFIWKEGESENKNLQIMSASYYIYELFFEPYL